MKYLHFGMVMALSLLSISSFAGTDGSIAKGDCQDWSHLYQIPDGYTVDQYNDMVYYIASFSVDGDGHKVADVCSSSTTLVEAVCAIDPALSTQKTPYYVVGTVNYTCPQGCLDGKCLGDFVPSAPAPVKGKGKR